MNKIIITPKMKDLHKKYFQEHVLPRIETERDNTNNIVLRSFLILCINRWEEIAIGDVDTLKMFYNDTIKPCYGNNILSDKFYIQKIYDLFGYEKFKVQNIYEYYRIEVLKNVSQTDCGDYGLLCSNIIKKLKDNFPEYSKKIDLKITNQIKFRKDKVRFLKEKMEELIIVDITIDNFVKYNVFYENWNPYYFVLTQGVRTCPYCNRQYITPIFSQKGKVRADLEHFWTKKKYPFFSMSIYNLVPSCKQCNSSLKGTKEFDLNSLHPYRDNISDYFYFKINKLNGSGSSVKIRSFLKKDEKRVAEYAEMFKLNTLYNYHENIVHDLITKRNKYSERNINILYEKNQEYFESEYYLRSIIVGGIPETGKLNDEPLSKFKRDIIDQLNFISNDKISKLRNCLRKI